MNFTSSTTPDGQRKLARVQTFLHEYDMSRSGLYRLVAAEKIKLVKVGKRAVRVDMDSVARHFAAAPLAAVRPALEQAAPAPEPATLEPAAAKKLASSRKLPPSKTIVAAQRRPARKATRQTAVA